MQWERKEQTRRSHFSDGLGLLLSAMLEPSGISGDGQSIEALSGFCSLRLFEASRWFHKLSAAGEEMNMKMD